jgi:uncharacterized membrane protein (UPF0127 family)
MKKIMLPALVCALCACGGYKKTTVTLPDGFVVNAEVADTPQKAEKGLMFRSKLAEDRGMLFVFDAAEPRMFWMKNTFIDLDIIFINSDGSVYSVSAGVPRSYSYTPDHQVAYAPGYGQYVLELAAGGARRHKITEGSKIEFELK